ncbi:hypothetical protein Tco_0832975 [Tanacetum coccineum]
MGKDEKKIVEANSCGLVGPRKWASIAVIVWFSSSPPEVAPLEWAPLFILLESYMTTREWWLPSRVSEAIAGLVLLLWHDASDFGPDMSFDTSASPKAIHNYMSWRHPSSVITDPKPATSSYSQADVRRLSASVVKLRDMPEAEGVLVLSSLSRVWKSRTRDPILRDSNGNGMEGGGAAVVPTPRVVGVSPPFLKELTITSTPSSVELFLKDAPPSSTIASEQNEVWLSVMVDTSNEEMVDAASDKPVEVFVQGVAHRVCEDVNQKQCGSPYSSDVLVTALADAGDAVVAALSRI